MLISINNSDPKNIGKITSKESYWHMINSDFPNAKKKWTLIYREFENVG